MDDGPWGRSGYDAVSWTEVEQDSRRIYRTETGSWELVITVLQGLGIGVAGNLLYTFLEPHIEQKLEEFRNRPDEERAAYRENVSKVLPLFNEADIFVGQRRHWVREKLDELDEELEAELEGMSLGTDIPGKMRERLRSVLGDADTSIQFEDLGVLDLGDAIDDDASIYDELDNVGSVSANELFQTLDLVVSANLAMNDEQPANVLFSNDGTVDFTSDLISIGGPIPNFYTRKVMYGDDIDLPYKFDLNPPGVEDDLASYSPEQLREIGLDDDRSLGHRPNWRIVDETGDPLEPPGDKTIPDWGNGQWTRDYFTVAKVPNVHPGAPPVDRAETKRALILAGCHGLGTRAALEALKSGEILDTIESEVQDGYFQLVGKVRRGGDAAITADDIDILDQYLQPLAIG